MGISAKELDEVFFSPVVRKPARNHNRSWDQSQSLEQVVTGRRTVARFEGCKCNCSSELQMLQLLKL